MTANSLVGSGAGEKTRCASSFLSSTVTLAYYPLLPSFVVKSEGYCLPFFSSERKVLECIVKADSQKNLRRIGSQRSIFDEK